MYNTATRIAILQRQEVSGPHLKSVLTGSDGFHAYHCKFQEGSLIELSKHPLKQIQFCVCNISTNSLVFHAALESFRIADNPIDVSGMDLLCKILEPLNNLISLQLDRCKIEDGSLIFIAKLNGLKHLYLNGNLITDAGTDSIRKLLELQSLYLRSNRISDQGMHRLCQLPQLVSLGISKNHLTNELNSIGKLTRLKQLSVNENPVNDAAVERLLSLRNLLLFDFDFQTEVTKRAVFLAQSRFRNRY